MKHWSTPWIGRAPGALCALALAIAGVSPTTTLAADAEPRSFEDEAATSASALLAPALLQGPHHKVRDEVESDGLIQTFTIESEFGTYQARGESMLRTRIREIEVLVVLRERSETDAFRDAEASVPQSPYVTGGSGWIGNGGDPDKAPAGLPAGSLSGGWNSGATRDAEGAPDSDQGWQQLMRVESHKRKIAASLGVDPYTTNPALQKALDRHAWVSFSSGAPPPAPRTAASQSEEGSPGDEEALVDERLRQFSSDDLERLNRIELVAMGIPEDLREEFIANPSYSHRVETVLVESLAALEGTEDRVAFIQAAVKASSEDEAQSYGQLAELMRHYGSQGGGLSRMLQVEGQVAAFTADGTLIVPVVADHAVWSERVAGFAESVARAAGDSPDSAKARFLFSGSLSNRALQEIQSLGIDVTQDALASEDAADDAAEAP